jgi:hypothetical protein
MKFMPFSTSPLEGEVGFQCEQKPASARKAGEGSCNQRRLFTPHHFSNSQESKFFRVEKFPLPQGARNKGNQVIQTKFLIKFKGSFIKELYEI